MPKKQAQFELFPWGGGEWTCSIGAGLRVPLMALHWISPLVMSLMELLLLCRDWVLLALHKKFFWTASSMIELLFSAVMYSGLWRMLDAFVICLWTGCRVCSVHCIELCWRYGGLVSAWEQWNKAESTWNAINLWKHAIRCYQASHVQTECCLFRWEQCLGSERNSFGS